MTADFLYPLSSGSGYRFKLDNGRLTPDTGPAAFQQMIFESGTDCEWGAYKNWRVIQPGDRIWVYYGTSDGDLGVVGLARALSVQAPKKPKGRAVITMRWDLKRTRELSRRPFPARKVRKSIPRAQAAVWTIGEALSSALLKHLQLKGEAKVPSRVSPRYAVGVSSTISYTRPKTVTVRRRHDAILRPLKTRLDVEGWTESRVNVQPKQVDLAMSKGRCTLIVEAKTVSHATSTEVRAAFAQLTEYAWRIRRESGGEETRLVLWSLFEKKPEDDEIRFLEDHDILVSWVSQGRKRVLHSPKTARHRIALSLGS